MKSAAPGRGGGMETEVTTLVSYPTLEREIAGRGIKKKAIAESIGVTYKSFSNKLSGRVPFTWPEVSTIRSRFFPDMTLEVSFKIEKPTA